MYSGIRKNNGDNYISFLTKGNLLMLQSGFCIIVFTAFVLGVGIDGGNDKDWEANACKISLIKKKGKVKALDEEVNSKFSIVHCTIFLNELLFLTSV